MALPPGQNRTPFTIIRDDFNYPAKDTELIFGSDYAHSEYVIPMARFKFFDATGADSTAPSIYIRLGGTFNTQLSNGYQETTGIFGGVTPGSKVGVEGLGEFSALLGKVKGSALEAIQKGLANALGAGVGYISSAGQSGKPQIEFLTRKLFNSFQQLIYQGPRFRAFQLPFNMKPTSYQEAKIMRDIIHTFRVASSPRSNFEDTLKEDDENALTNSSGSGVDAEALKAELEAMSDEDRRIKLTELGLDAFNNETGAEIMEASNAPLTFGYPDMVQLEFILYKKGSGTPKGVGPNMDDNLDTITMLFQSEYCMIENVGLDYGAQNKMVFLSSPESADTSDKEVGDYFPSEVNMTIALKESVLITAAYASAEHGTAGRTIF
jgi:hypothetical protein